MDRYYQANSASDAPSAPASNPGGYPKNGNPAVGRNGTVPGDWWYHAVTEELRNAIVALGGTPDFTQVDQLAKALTHGFANTAQSVIARLAAIALSGSYNDLKDKPAIPAAQVNADWKATSGPAAILNKPTIPGGQVNADWNATSGPALILNKPAIVSNLPTLIIDVGNGSQPNGGRGIDRDEYYQLDFHIGTTAYNNFPYVVNSDGTFTVAPGLYLVAGYLQIVAPVADTYQLPTQMTFATGRLDRWPGNIHDSIRADPAPPTTTQSVQGSLGMIVISGVQKWDDDYEVWMGFSKLLGTTSQTPLKLFGSLSVTQTTASWPGIKLWPDMARRAGEL